MNKLVLLKYREYCKAIIDNLASNATDEQKLFWRKLRDFFHDCYMSSNDIPLTTRLELSQMMEVTLYVMTNAPQLKEQMLELEANAERLHNERKEQ